MTTINASIPVKFVDGSYIPNVHVQQPKNIHEINLFAKYVAENMRKKSSLINIQKYVVKVSFSFYCFNLKFNNHAWLRGSPSAGSSY